MIRLTPYGLHVADLMLYRQSLCSYYYVVSVDKTAV